MLVKLYFAFGSNMSLARIEARTGKVSCLGAAKLPGFAHRFSHCGDDGSGKGNIARDESTETWGVVYRLSEEQADTLHQYEPGYESIEVSVVVRDSNTPVTAYAYLSGQGCAGLLPSSEYLGHYRRGMAENRLPDSYVLTIEEQAGQ